jgi:hypothetical protein
MKRFISVLMLVLLAALTGCASNGIDIPEDPYEKVIWSSSPERPGWIYEEPGAAVDGVLTFVGLSDKVSTEKGSRDDARRNATSAVVKYMGTLAKNKFEKATVSFGLQSDVVDPTAGAREFEKQMSVNVANQVKAKSWYIEKLLTPTGVGYVTYVQAQVPQSAVDESYKSTTQSMAKDAERKAKEAGDAVAKDQAVKAAEFWKQMSEQGVTE